MGTSESTYGIPEENMLSFLPDFIFSDREAFASEDELAFPRTALRSPSVPLW